jgi:alanyl-tRNA synthetase
MKKMTSKELRRAWIEFYEQRGHLDIGQTSLIGDGTTGVLFNVAGMQPLMPYLLGQKHPSGKTRLCNIQGCVRTNDIESIGDSSHVSFFEMMGSWSLGDYFKEERTKWSYELLTKVFEIPQERLAATVFEGNESVPRDDETAYLREKSGFLKKNIYYLPKSDNWWELDRGPCGPDSEMFYITDKPACGPNCSPACSCGHFVEVGNDVFMQYERIDDDKYIPLKQKNVDTGWGFERILAFLNTNGDVYLTDLFEGAIKILENASGKKYGENKQDTYSIRIVADHIRTSVMLLGDKAHLVPSNIGAGYILRRLIRRAVRHAKILGVSTSVFNDLVSYFIDDVYGEFYEGLKESKEFVLQELGKEVKKFENTLSAGIKEFERVTKNMNKGEKLDGANTFRLYDTFGFPLELTEELANERGLFVDKEGYEQKFKEHQEKSRGNIGTFKGGLESTGEMETKYHTATHLLNAALKVVVNSDIHQMGSNITSERLRFDFNCDHKLSDEEKQKVEDLVNEWIAKDLQVTKTYMKKQDAVASGAECMFLEKYPDEVSVYTIGDVSKELCGGPHVEHTGVLGKFVIKKEESSSSGVRRIKAILE